MPAFADLRIGTDLAGYRIEGLIGRGGMGTVYRAHDPRLKRDVALKLLRAELAEDSRFRERFLSESEVAAGLEHPNVVPIHDVDEADGQLFIVMRLVEEGDLRSLLIRERKLDARRALALVSQVAAALDAAHDRGLVHRDVKPSNVLVDRRDHAYLVDFGLSRRLADQAAGFEAGLSLGTPAYVAPEQIEGKEVDGRADQYSLGCLLYQCLAGELPFPRSSEAAVLFAHLEESPPSLPGLEELLSTALAKSPAARYESCAELVGAAADALGIDVRRRNLWPVAVAAVGVAVVAASLAAFFLARGGGTAPAALPGADTLVRIDPATNSVTDRVPVGRDATGLAASARYVWVTSFADGNVWRLDTRTRAVLQIPTRGTPTDVAASADVVLVANGPQNLLTPIDPRNGVVGPVTRLGAENGIGWVRVAAGRSGVWFADPGGRAVDLVKKSHGLTATQTPIPVPPDRTSMTATYESFDGFAAIGSDLWLAGDAQGRALWRLDATTRKLVATIPLPFVPAGVAASDDAVWVTSLLDDTVVRIDPATERITRSIRVGRGASAVSVGRDAVWVVNSIDGTVSRIDPATNRVVATIPVGSSPGRIAVSAGGVWVTTAPARPVHPPAKAIEIGVLSDCKGRYAFTRAATLAGAELALVERGGRRSGPSLTDGVGGVAIGGNPVHLVFGCSDTTTASALAEARRLVDGVGVRILIGPLGGNQGLALQEFARRRPGVAFVNGTSSAQLLHPAPNFFSFHTDGAGWTAGLGAYAYRTLGWRRAAVVADLADDTFNWTQVAGFVAEFCSLGGTITSRVWVPPGTQDYSRVVAEVPRAGVDGFFFATYDDPIIAFADSYPGLRGNVSRRIIAGSFVDLSGLHTLGARARGLVGGGAEGAGDLNGYLRRYRKAFPRDTGFAGSYFDVFYHDAMAATLGALTSVQGDLSGGERRFMDALARFRLVSPLGTIRLDRDRQAIAFNTLYRDNRPFRSIAGVDHTFGGYFKPTDSPPTESTPACVKRAPPPWAR